MAKSPWKCWHEVVKLRDDLRSGELPLHMFAADLYEVLMQSGKRPDLRGPGAVLRAHLSQPTTCASWCGTWCCGWRARMTKRCASLS